MKKFLALILALLLLLVSCGGLEAPTETPTDAPTQAETQTPAKPAEDATEGEDVTSDPYANVNKDEFYKNYTPAQSASDAYFRTEHDLMSGDISAQDQRPTMAPNRPTENGKYIRNTSYRFSDEGDAYYVYDASGRVANIIYRDGAYVTLEEVAAYVYAYGTIPPNYSSSKKTDPEDSPWGVYLRLNHSKFSGNTKKYPYEPVLPDISGCGGDLQYYEIDIGTTGTDCDPGYTVAEYNNGSWITRGAARIVYTHYDKDFDGVIEIGEVYVFYTYNHYNDFQEYLNYEGGWGEMFGNVTGGGELSSKTDYNPTPYVETAYADFSDDSFGTSATSICIILPYIDIEKRQLI